MKSESADGQKTDRQNKGTLKNTDTNYPRLVRELITRPPDLYYRGDLSLLRTTTMLAVVGSRATTAQTVSSLDHVLGPIQNQALVIVSGLALGLDARAHEIALANGLPTIAVLGSSIEYGEIYPRMNLRLAQRIVERDGLLLSPFPPKTAIRNYNFPARNQIIAAIAHATLVASAAERSGALITARFSLDYGKDVFVIPGPVTESLYRGSNRLLQDGALAALESNDILSHFKLAAGTPRVYDNASESERQLLTLLRERARTLAELVSLTKRSPAELNALASSCELKGWIRQNPDGSIQLT